MNTIYNSAHQYDDIHWWKKNDLTFWSEIFNETEGNKVLELACGTGRIATSFLRQGANYTGVDNNPLYITCAKNKYIKYSTMANFYNKNMKSFKFNKKYDLILIGFNSFLHLETNPEVRKFFNCVKQHMHNKSRFIIDIYTPNPLFLYRPKNFRLKTLEYIDSQTQEKIFIEESNNYDPNTDINKIFWYFSTKENKDFDIKEFSVRMYYPSTMNKLIIENNFNIVNQWGSYKKENLNADSKLQIYDLAI